MILTTLNAISPIDGRYRKSTHDLASFFSETALIEHRVLIEVEYFIALCKLEIPQLANFDKTRFTELREIYERFDEKEAQRIKDIENITNHDVKAVEYYLKEVFESKGLSEFSEYIHFGLTSQDINNTAFPLLFKKSIEKIYLPEIHELVFKLIKFSEDWKDIPMLAHTHGQPASPTRLGKEIQVFIERIESQLQLFKHIPFSAKFGGATGNFNAHKAAFPEID